MSYLFINNDKINYKLQWIKASALITNSNQTRNRNDVGSLAQINQIASNLQPELLAQSFELASGAPVIDFNNQIISGHGRIEAIKQAYNTHKKLYYNYNQYLQNNVHLCEYANIATGLNEAYILCRVISAQHNTVEAVHAANNTTLSYTPYELAKINSKRLKSDINQFITSLPLLEQAQYFTDGILNLKAYQDYQNARIIAALPNCTILADFINYPNPDYKNVITAILNNIDKILEIQANNVELFDQFALALDKFLQIKQNGGNVEDFLLQLDMFDSGLNGAYFSNCLSILWKNTRSAKALTSELAIFLNHQTNLDLFDTLETEIISDTYEIHANENHSHVEVANENHSHLITNLNNGLLEPTPPPLKIITPHDWQQHTIDRIMQVQSPTTNKLLVSAPTGSGKAFLLMFIIQSMLQCNKRILLLVDRCKLVNQLCESANQFGFNYNVIMGNIKQFDDKLLTIASIQTFYKLPHPPQFDVILVDECHTLYKSVINHIARHKGLVIGCTATPVTAGLKRHYPTLINEITQLELEQQKILTPLRIEEKRYIDMDNAPINSRGEWDAREIVTRCQVGFDNWIVDNIVESLTQHNHALAFCASIDHCKQLQVRLNHHGIKSAIYTSQQDTKEREDILTKYESGLTQVLITVATLSKGFDCKIIDLIIDLRPLRNSLAEYVQMQGRGTRINEGKNTCTVLDFTGNWQRFKQSIQDMRINGVKSVYELTWTELDEIVSTQGVTRRKAEYIAFAATDDGKAINERIIKNQDTILELERLINLEKIKSKAKNPIPPPPIVKSSMWNKLINFLRN